MARGRATITAAASGRRAFEQIAGAAWLATLQDPRSPAIGWGCGEFKINGFGRADKRAARDAEIFHESPIHRL
jgi:hypothetical protein